MIYTGFGGVDGTSYAPGGYMKRKSDSSQALAEWETWSHPFGDGEERRRRRQSSQDRARGRVRDLPENLTPEDKSEPSLGETYLEERANWQHPFRRKP